MSRKVTRNEFYKKLFYMTDVYIAWVLGTFFFVLINIMFQTVAVAVEYFRRFFCLQISVYWEFLTVSFLNLITRKKKN